MTKLRPMHDRLLVRRIEGEDRTQGGLFIPDTAKEKPMEGKIIAVGEGKLDQVGKLRPLALFQGQRVLFDRHAGAEIQLGGAEHLIIREDDVLAVLD
jgi:chaperonin GroES